MTNSARNLTADWNIHWNQASGMMIYREALDRYFGFRPLRITSLRPASAFHVGTWWPLGRQSLPFTVDPTTVYWMSTIKSLRTRLRRSSNSLSKEHGSLLGKCPSLFLTKRVWRPDDLCDSQCFRDQVMRMNYLFIAHYQNEALLWNVVVTFYDWQAN